MIHLKFPQFMDFRYIENKLYFLCNVAANIVRNVITLYLLKIKQ